MVGELQGLSLCLKNPSRKPKPNPKPSTRPRRLQPSIKDQNSGMVWFQCEDCGENLKKPKHPNHFRMCSAYKLSCIDCGLTFNRESVQTHTQCISEANFSNDGNKKIAGSKLILRPAGKAKVDKESNERHHLLSDEESSRLGIYDKPLPCFGCGIGWFSFLAGFVCPLLWYYATILYFGNYYRKDPRERGGLVASAIAALVCTVAVCITMLVILL